MDYAQNLKRVQKSLVQILISDVCPEIIEAKSHHFKPMEKI